MKKYLFFAGWVAAILCLNAARLYAGVAADGAKLEKLADGFAFAEGPSHDAAGNVYFTDQPNDRILKWSVEGRLSTYKQPAGRPNGTYFSAQGDLIVCADETNQLWAIAPSGAVSVWVTNYDGKLLNGPNDVWARPDGGIYFTDPYYQRPYWKRGPKEQDGEHVYFLSPDHRHLNRVATDLKQPNGIIGTPDGQRLYVADIGAGKTYRYQIQPDGTLADKTLFCPMGSDGMTMDDQENLYLSGHGVLVFDKSGKRIDHLAVDESWVGNVCFGGQDGRTLFITASKSLYSLKTRFKGANVGK
jgi:gluconolactonase